MSYTLGTAAKATGRSKTTIQRAIASGKISAVKNDNGSYSIDPAELHRVFHVTASRDNDKTEYEHPERLLLKLEILETERERERAQMQAALDDLRSDRDAWKQQATALLTAPVEKRRRWWQWK